MLRSIGVVVLGVIGWGALWNGFWFALRAARPDTFTEEMATSDATNLVALLGVSVLLSIGFGFVVAKLAGRAPMNHALALGIVNLLIGIGVQATSWDAFPLWYHIPFLLLVVPATLAGGKAGAGRNSAPA